MTLVAITPARPQTGARVQRPPLESLGPTSETLLSTGTLDCTMAASQTIHTLPRVRMTDLLTVTLNRRIQKETYATPTNVRL